MSIEITQGTDEVLTLSVKQSSAVGAPAENITSWTIWFTAKKRLTDADPGVFQKTTPAGITITDALGGIAKIEVAAADTAPLSDDYGANLYYDVKIKNAANKIKTIDSGRLLVRTDVTKSSA
jgi:predicted HD phosphohydrolase